MRMQASWWQWPRKYQDQTRGCLVLALLAAGGLLAGCSKSPLYTDLTETQANEVQAALLSAHIDAQKAAMVKSKGWSISVAHGAIPQAMAVLNAAGLPREPLHTLGDVFPKEGFVSSPLEERARYVFALSQEVEQTLLRLDGVVDARVHIALPERNLLDDKPQSASASVVIIERPGADLESRETDIKAIVTDGIEGLRDVNRVTVKFFVRRPPGTLAAGLGAQTAPNWSVPLGAGAGLLLFAVVGGAGVRYLRRQGGAGSRPLR
jgi:type III secretion protein J